MVKKTFQVRVLTDGICKKLMDKIAKQFEAKHGFAPSSDQILEAMASAIEAKKLFG